MATGNVAKGALVLSLDAQQLDAGLKKTAVKAKEAGKGLAENFRASAGDLLKERTGGDMGLVGMAGKAGWIGAVVAGVGLLANEVWDAVGPAKELAKQLERNEDSARRWRETMAEGVAELKEWNASISDIAGTDGGIRQLDNSILRMNLKLGIATDKMNEARKAAEGWDSKWNSWDAFSNWIVGNRESKHQSATKVFEEMKGSAEETRKALEELEKQRRRLADPTTNPASVAALRQYVQELTDARRQLNGVDEDAIKIDRLKRQYGFKDKDLEEVRSAVQAKNRAKAAADLRQATEEATNWMRELEDEVGLYGVAVRKSAEDAKLAEFIKKGIDQREVDRLRALIELKKVATEQYKPLQGIRRGTVAEVSFNTRAQFEQQRNKTLEEIKRLITSGNSHLVKINQGVRAIDLDKPEI